MIKQFILALFLISSTFQEGKKHYYNCMISQCQDCDFINVYTCNQCNPGFYLQNYYSEEKARRYQACLSKVKVAWSMLGLLLLAIMQCLCVYYCYKCNVKKIRVQEEQEVEYQDQRNADEGSDDLVQVQQPAAQAPSQPLFTESAYNPNQQIPQVQNHQIPPQVHNFNQQIPAQNHQQNQNNHWPNHQGYQANNVAVGHGGHWRTAERRKSDRRIRSRTGKKPRRKSGKKRNYTVSPKIMRKRNRRKSNQGSSKKKYLRRKKSRSRSRSRSRSKKRIRY